MNKVVAVSNITKSRLSNQGLDSVVKVIVVPKDTTDGDTAITYLIHPNEHKILSFSPKDSYLLVE